MSAPVLSPNVANAAAQEGQLGGLTPAEIQVAQAIALAEGGTNGNAVGDNGTSFGPLQFHQGGELDGFAAWLGVTEQQAANVAQTDPARVFEYALGPNGYLADALKQGSGQGLSGLNLALYAEQYGQRAAQSGGQLAASVAANVTAAWNQLFGGAPLAGSATPTQTPAAKAPASGPTWTIAPGVNIPLPDLSGLSGSTASDKGLGAVSTSISQAAQALGAIPAGISSGIAAAVSSLERFAWIAFGLLIAGVGLWLVVKNDELEAARDT